MDRSYMEFLLSRLCSSIDDCKTTKEKKLSSDHNQESSGTDITSVDYLSDDCPLVFRHRWSLTGPRELVRCARMCWKLLQQAAREDQQGKSFHYQQFFSGTSHRLPSQIITDLQDEEIAELAVFPQNCFVLDVNLPAVRELVDSCSEIFLMENCTYDPWNENVVTIVVEFLKTGGRIYPGSFGTTLEVYQELRKLSIPQIRQAVGDQILVLKCIVAQEQLDFLRFIPLLRQDLSAVIKNTSPDEDVLININMMRKDALQNLSSFFARIAGKINSGNSDLSVRVTDPPSFIRQELLPVEFMQLGFTIGDVSHITGVSQKKLRRQRRENIRHIYKGIQSLPEDIRHKTSMTRVEYSGHKTLFANIMLFTEAVYAGFLSSSFVRQQKFLQSCEIYYQVVNYLGTWAGSLYPHQMYSWRQDVGNCSMYDFLADCVRKHHDFVFLHTFTDARGNCPFCRKHFLSQRLEYKHRQFLLRYLVSRDK